MVIERAREIFGARADEPTTSLELVPNEARHEPEPEPERPARDRDAPASPVLRLIEQTRAEREARSDRVADLFPRPETTEWNVREISYDRARRARVSP